VVMTEDVDSFYLRGALEGSDVLERFSKLVVDWTVPGIYTGYLLANSLLFSLSSIKLL
jgi:hypothetical protein